MSHQPTVLVLAAGCHGPMLCGCGISSGKESCEHLPHFPAPLAPAPHSQSHDAVCGAATLPGPTAQIPSAAPTSTLHLVLHLGAAPANMRKKGAEGWAAPALPCTGTCSPPTAPAVPPHQTVLLQPLGASSIHRLSPQAISCLSFHYCHDNIAGQNLRL